MMLLFLACNQIQKIENLEKLTNLKMLRLSIDYLTLSGEPNYQNLKS